MKVQSILIALLQAHAALSSSSNPEVDDDCGAPCKTGLRSTSLQLEECFKAHCGTPVEVAVDEEEDVSNYGQCISRCNRLRFGPSKKATCLNKCDAEYKGSPESSPTFSSTGNRPFSVPSPTPGRRPYNGNNGYVPTGSRPNGVPTRQQRRQNNNNNNNPFPSSGNNASNNSNNSSGSAACKGRCMRLRFSPDMQQECVHNCDKNDGFLDDFKGEFSKEGTAAPFANAGRHAPSGAPPGNRAGSQPPFRDAGRHAPSGNTPATDGSEDETRSNFEDGQKAADEETDFDAADNNGYGHCVSICHRLRFGPQKKVKCLDDCETKYGPTTTTPTTARQENKEEKAAEDEETDFDAADNNGYGHCVSICHRLRFGPQKKAQCLEDCETKFGSTATTPTTARQENKEENDAEDEETDFDAADNNGYGHCVSICHRLRFGPQKKAQCLDDCETKYGPTVTTPTTARQENKEKKAAEDEETDFDAANNNGYGQCVSRCNRLRFGPSRKASCLQRCEDNYGSEAENRSASATSSTLPAQDPSTMQCEARCRMLRFSTDMQQECIHNCHKNDEDGLCDGIVRKFICCWMVV